MKNRLLVIWYVLTDKYFRYYGARREERIFEDMERDLDQHKNDAVYLHIPTKKKINMGTKNK